MALSTTSETADSKPTVWVSIGPRIFLGIGAPELRGLWPYISYRDEKKSQSRNIRKYLGIFRDPKKSPIEGKNMS